MRYTILVATLSAVVASVLTTAAISGSFFGADTASSASTAAEAVAAVSPGGVESILQGDLNCDGVVDTHDTLGGLRFLGELDVQQTEPCPDIGTLAAIPGPAGPQGPAGPAGPPGPAGPEGAPGISEFAQVSAAGEVKFGTAISAEDIGGSYRVNFGRDLSECTAVASPGITSSGTVPANTRLEHTLVNFQDPTEVILTFVDADTGDNVSTGFHLIVVC